MYVNRDLLAVEPEIGSNWSRGNRDKSSAMQSTQTSSLGPVVAVEALPAAVYLPGSRRRSGGPEAEAEPCFSLCDLAVVYFGCGLLGRVSVFDPPLPDEVVGLRHRLAGAVVFVVFPPPEQVLNVEDAGHPDTTLIPPELNPSLSGHVFSTLFSIEIHLDLEWLCFALGPEEVGLPSPCPDVDVWGPRGAVVADLPDDVSPAGGVPFLYLNLLGVGVSNGDAVLLVLKDNEPGLPVPVHGSGFVGTVRPPYLHSFAFEWGQDILPPPASVFVPHQPSLSLPAVPGL